MEKETIVDVLLENIKIDQDLLEQSEKNIQEAKEAKREVTSRLKDYRNDVSVLLKYANEDQRKKIEELGFEFSESEKGLNPVATVFMDILMKVKDNKMSNGDLYDKYVKTFKNPEDAFSYTEFNIKSRSLFNTQRVLRTKGKNDSSSRDNIISLNGHVMPEEKKDESK